MVVIIILAVLLIGVLIAIVWLIKQHFFFKDIVKQTKKCNVIIAGKIGTGKGILTQKIINARKEPYYGNVDFGGDFEKIAIKDISVEPNTYDDFINEKVVQVKRRFVEKKDIYIDDGGVYLPSYMDSKLYKTYPSLPIYYALCRHSADHHIHVNVQNYERLWKALREQGDFYITCKKTFHIFGIFFTKCITYDKYQSALAGVLPLKARMLNKYSKAEVDIYNASNGEIRSGWIISFKKNLHYNSRYFEKVLYGEQERITE